MGTTAHTTATTSCGGCSGHTQAEFACACACTLLVAAQERNHRRSADGCTRPTDAQSILQHSHGSKATDFGAMRVLRAELLNHVHPSRTAIVQQFFQCSQRA